MPFQPFDWVSNFIYNHIMKPINAIKYTRKTISIFLNVNHIFNHPISVIPIHPKQFMILTKLYKIFKMSK